MNNEILNGIILIVLQCITLFYPHFVLSYTLATRVNNESKIGAILISLIPFVNLWKIAKVSNKLEKVSLSIAILSWIVIALTAVVRFWITVYVGLHYYATIAMVSVLVINYILCIYQLCYLTHLFDAPKAFYLFSLIPPITAFLLPPRLKIFLNKNRDKIEGRFIDLDDE